MEKEDLSQLKITRTEGDRTIRKKPRSKKRIFLILLLLLAILSGILYFFGWLTPAKEMAVTTVSQVYPSQAVTLLNASGYVVAQRKAAVASKGTGRLEYLGVEEGNRVKKGQILARIENADLQAAQNQAQANLTVTRAHLAQIQAELKDARIKFERFQKLIQQQAISQSDYDTTQARFQQLQAGEAAAVSQIKAAEAALQSSQVALEYTLIRAPFNGVILTKYADVGEVVAPFGSSANAKAAVVTMADMDSLIVETDVSEINIEKVKTDQPCEIILDGLPGVRFQGKVHMIVPTADRSKATILTKVKFLEKDERILPEMSAKVAFLSRPVARDQQPSLAVPPSAVVVKNGRSVVYRLEGEKTIETPVKVGKPLAELTEITQGLKAGQKIILKPNRTMRDGMRIKVTEK
jgi:RND family efflux transporter MFP subunit